MKRIVLAAALMAIACGKSTGPGAVATGSYALAVSLSPTASIAAASYSGTATISRVTTDSIYANFGVTGWPTTTVKGTWNSDAYRMVVELPHTSVVLRVAAAGSGVTCSASSYNITGSGGLVSGGGICTMSR